MRNVESWSPTFVRTGAKGRPPVGRTDKVYAGSTYVSALQIKSVGPIIQHYACGALLDLGCGKVPYYEVYRDQVESVYCIDHEKDNPFADVQHDLEHPLPVADESFDTIVMLDVIAHIYHQEKLIIECARALRKNGHLLLSTPFVYWISAYPHEYFHPTESALRKMCEAAQLEIIELKPYGGYPDVLLDTLNKGMTGRIGRRLFDMFKSIVIKTGAYRKSNEKTRYSYPLGYTLVARRK
jgi:SAM-dependent methyltransferase